MIVIPAIDLKEGKCVRLSQGRMDQATVYSEDPVRMARHWEAKGAERLHVVDLDGAIQGRPVERSLIGEIVCSVRIPVEVGGGIRDLGTIEQYLSLGVQWIIVGTLAFQNPALVEEALRLFPGRIILSVDARGERVAIQGWRELLPLESREMVKRFEGLGLSAIVFTDIERDGTEGGINLASTRALARETSVPLIASGGLARIEELHRLKELEPLGLIGVIVGRALYTGQIDLREAIRISKSPLGSAKSQVPDLK